MFAGIGRSRWPASCRDYLLMHSCSPTPVAHTQAVSMNLLLVAPNDRHGAAITCPLSTQLLHQAMNRTNPEPCRVPFVSAETIDTIGALILWRSSARVE